MSNPDQKDKAEESTQDIKKTKEYRRFKAMLKKVIKAPPMRKPNEQQAEPSET